MAQASPARHRNRSKNLGQIIVDEMLRRIRDGILRQGDKLPPEPAMMAEFGVSKTVVREALSWLQAGGFVETRHGVGTFILPQSGLDVMFPEVRHAVTISDVIAMMELRAGLEIEAAGMASMRAEAEDLAAIGAARRDFDAMVERRNPAVEADRAFHMAIARAAKNEYFIKIFNFLGEMIPRGRLDTAHFGNESGKDFLNRTCREHEVIHKAIAGRDHATARAAMRMHLHASLERLIKAQKILAAPTVEAENIRVRS